MKYLHMVQEDINNQSYTVKYFAAVLWKNTSLDPFFFSVCVNLMLHSFLSHHCEKQIIPWT